MEAEVLQEALIPERGKIQLKLLRADVLKSVSVLFLLTNFIYKVIIETNQFRFRHPVLKRSD